MSTKVDLEELLEAAGASEARDEAWIAAEDLKAGVGMEPEDARYVAAAKPEVVTALVWRIRELEETLGKVLASATPNRRDNPTMREAWDAAGLVLTKGTVMP